MMKKPLAACGLAMFALSAVAAENDGWYLVPQLDYTFADGDRRVDDDLALGLGLGKHLNDRWSLEFNALKGQHGADVGGDLDLTAVSVDVLRQFNRAGHVSPYLTAGLGALSNDFSPGASRDDFMAQVGAGLLIRTWESADGSSAFSLRPEAKLRWEDAGGAGHLLDVLAGIGFQFDFGAPRRVATAQTPLPAPAAVPAAAPPPVVAAPAKPLDSDGDGVIDDKDRCPGTPSGTAVEESGCPLRGSITLVGVNFENNSARLLPDSLSVLETVSADLKRHPRLKVEVQGHTDSMGSDAYNLKLSQSRAEAVRDHLVGRGVDIAQLTARGYGETMPVAANESADGRGKNRRVALQVVENPGDVDVKQGQ